MVDEWELVKQGAEAKIFFTEFYNRPTVVKQRFCKCYRHPSLDEKLTRRRTTQEVRSMLRCRKVGITTPTVYFVDYEAFCIYMERIEDCMTVRDVVNGLLEDSSLQATEKLYELAKEIGVLLAKMHQVDCIHGDLTTSNLLSKNSSNAITIIDFGLSSVSSLAEDKGVDLYVLERAFLSTHPNTEKIFEAILDAYRKNARNATEVIKKLDEIRMRGRKRTMVG
ncbi:predicted protein [Nematostella vectensis]|uniref:non-specific serine/threonine protein kinase n=1 Tax=Nematostella vectensis TaxID=45351 RepID=A7STD0_NEMVE|nr:predicted protein [Nematostella vectensis]|eukprot:XP_001625126.1 predicted protein [Nematostella vectensis]